MCLPPSQSLPHSRSVSLSKKKIISLLDCKCMWRSQSEICKFGNKAFLVDSGGCCCLQKVQAERGRSQGAVWPSWWPLTVRAGSFIEQKRGYLAECLGDMEGRLKGLSVESGVFKEQGLPGEGPRTSARRPCVDSCEPGSVCKPGLVSQSQNL